MDTLSKQQEVETKPQAEDMENEVEAIQRKTPDDDNAKEKVIRDKASAILESWSNSRFQKMSNVHSMSAKLSRPQLLKGHHQRPRK